MLPSIIDVVSQHIVWYMVQRCSNIYPERQLLVRNMAKMPAVSDTNENLFTFSVFVQMAVTMEAK
jgi:hypothetical protein